MSATIALLDQPGPHTWKEITSGLDAFNAAVAGAHDYSLMVLAVRDAGGQVVGGLWGRVFYRWLFIQVLYLPEGLRRQGMGSAVVRRAEAEARARGCIGGVVDTFSFQARPFYERLGFTVFGTLPDYPPGFTCYY